MPQHDVSYDRLLRLYTRGYVSACVYLNVRQQKEYYDVVLRRKVRQKGGGQSTWVRGANFKPSDIQDLLDLLGDVRDYLQSVASTDGRGLNST